MLKREPIDIEDIMFRALHKAKYRVGEDNFQNSYYIA
jgi:hypothetical protein